ncbi:MAG: transcription antitermination factor NusB [Bacteroidales bacterium]|jgi:N utilization substance protein B|nr:transcription antitermination factor NusB [Bacteroidales bacterium]
MISRRLLRIKILQICYAYLKSQGKTLGQAEKELFFSIQKSYDLYHYLLLLVVDLVKYARSRIDLAAQKLVPTYEDLNPNTKFVDNKLVKQLEQNQSLRKYLNDSKLSWSKYPELIKNLFLEIKDSEIYQNYMNVEERSYKEDKKFIIDLYAKIIILHEPLHQNLEEQSIYWNDDLEFVVGMIIRTLKNFKASTGESEQLMQLFKNEEDRDFAKRLFRKTIINHQEYQQLIADYIKNWDIERVAFTDIVVMQLAVAELIEFNEIPVKVTLDEYIEIAKFYSTQKSNVFINGVLDKMVADLKEDGRIKKTGRGLIGEI